MSDEVEVVEPLDAYATAKPNEPVFTLQGGDPLAAPLVRMWAWLARIRAGVTKAHPMDREPAVAEAWDAAKSSIVDNEREQDSLKIRATAAEQVSWDMDAYRKGQDVVVVETVVAENDTPEEVARIDLHDYRVRSAQKISNAVAEMVEISEELAKRGFVQGVPALQRIAWQLRNVADLVEPRRALKKGPDHVGQ